METEPLVDKSNWFTFTMTGLILADQADNAVQILVIRKTN